MAALSRHVIPKDGPWPIVPSESPLQTGHRCINGCVTVINPVAQRLTGWSVDQACGHQIDEVFRAVDAGTRDPVPGQIPRILEKMALPEGDQQLLISKDGQEIRISESSSPITDSAGKTVGVVLVFRDVSEEYAIQQRLRHSEKMDAIGQLAGGVAHDFNNMLGGIIGASEALSKYLPDDDKPKRLHHLVLDSASRAAGLTQRLLTFSRRQTVKKTHIDVHESIQAAIELLQSSLDKRIRIRTDLLAVQSHVFGDTTQLQNAFLNLGINSGHAMPDGGELRISTRNRELGSTSCDASRSKLTPGHYVEIEVADTGCGIVAGDIAHVFEPFFTTRGEGEGTGLGLAAVSKTIEEMGGCIQVESELSAGTTFRIHLPVFEFRSGIEEESSDIISGSGRILVVDDEEVMRSTAKIFLEEIGYEVALAENGAVAAELFSRDPASFGLVILDLVMPQMNGRDCLHRLREMDPDVKVLLVSGFAYNVARGGIEKLAAQGFMHKPYRRAELAKAVNEILQG